MAEKKSEKPFEYVNAILSTKQDMDTSDYPSVFINLALSQHADCILYVHELVKRPNIPNEQQFQFYLNSIPVKKRRFGKWAKRSDKDDENIKLISEFYEVNEQVAKYFLKILTPEQLKVLKPKNE